MIGQEGGRCPSACSSSRSPRGAAVAGDRGASRRPRRACSERLPTTDPAWSPDGSLIAFARAKVQSTFDGKTGLYVIERDGSDLRLVARQRHFARASYGVAWSPDGRTIAFETSPSIGCMSISLVDLREASLTL